MSPQSSRRFDSCRRWLLLCAKAATLLTTGCASWQLPRIDPSGESILIWPNQSLNVAVGPPASPPLALPGTPVVPASPILPPPIPAPPVGLPAGNVQAAPVYSDVPAAPLAAPQHTFGPAPVVTVPIAPTTPASQPVPVVAQSIPVPPPGAVPLGQDYLRITPDRVLAPVGSEVVLKAGICSSAGFLVTDRRIEWLLDRGGAGQFADVGERNQLDIFRSPLDTPHKVDNWYVVGATSGTPEVLTRGTPDPSDDIQVLDGEAWVTVTSASEGTSRVTAYTPEISNWQFRQASATIYWVDAQWIFPPSAVVVPGRPHVLTTAVMRRTDGAPLAGWIVRYEVGGGGSLGYEGGKSVEVPVDPAGRASVEVSPADLGGGSTTVTIAIVRPQTAPPNASPRLEIGRSSATISWGAGATPPGTPTPAIGAPSASGIPGLPPPPAGPAGSAPIPATSTPPLEPSPRPSLPNTPTSPYSVPRNEPPPGRPVLEVTLRRTSQEAVGAGDFVSYDVTVTNRGDGVARNIVVRDQFDRGLSHLKAKPNEYSIEYLGIRDLRPNESETLPLTFEVVSPGQHCHRVTVTADGAEPATQQECILTRTAAIEVTVTGPTRRIVGETASFNIAIRNVGDVAATDLEVVSKCDAALNPSATEEDHKRLPDGSVLFHVDRVEVGGKQTIPMVAQCVADADNACNHVTVSSGGQVLSLHQACIEILPQLPANGAALGNQPAAAAPSSELQATIVSNKNPTVVGDSTDLIVTVTNTGQQPAQQVTLMVHLPVELIPDDARIQPQGQFTRRNQELLFNPVQQLAPNQQMTAVIPVNPNRPGQVRVQASVAATGLATPLHVDSQVIEIQSETL